MSIDNCTYAPQIIDVRIRDVDPSNETHGEGANVQLRQQIIDGLSKPTGKKTMPTMLLYDERGLRLYDRITTGCLEYYLFLAEEAILKAKSDEIVQTMCVRDGEVDTTAKPVVLELGAG